MMAGHERIDGRQPVDEAVAHQEIQRAVNGRRRVGTHFRTHLFEQIIGLDRLTALRNQAQHLLPDRSQAQTTFSTDGLDGFQIRAGIMHMMMRMRTGWCTRAHCGSDPMAACRRANAVSRPQR